MWGAKGDPRPCPQVSLDLGLSDLVLFLCSSIHPSGKYLLSSYYVLGKCWRGKVKVPAVPEFKF